MSHHVEPQGPALRGLTFEDVRAFVRANLRLIALSGAASVALGFVYAMTAPPYFTAQATLVIDSAQEQLSTIDNVNRAGPQDVAAVETQMQILRSQRVAVEVARRLNLADHPTFQPEPEGAVRTALGAVRSGIRQVIGLVVGGGAQAPRNEPPPASPEERAAEQVRDKLEVRRVGAAHVIEVAFTSRDPALSAAVANAVTQAYIVEQRQSRYDAGQDASSWMEARVRQLRDQVSEAARAAQVFRARHNLVRVNEDGTLLIEHQLSQLNMRLSEAKSEMAGAQARLRTVQSALTSGQFDADAGDATGNAVLTQLREQYRLAVNRLTDAESRYGSDHVTVRSASEEIERLKGALRSELRRIATTLQANAQSSEDRVRQLEESLQGLITTAKADDEARVQLQQLETIARAYKATYESYLQRYTQILQQQSAPILAARLITPAAQPTAPSAPRKGLILVVMAMLGGAVGVAIGIMRAALDRSVRLPDQLAETGLPCLAVLPAVRDDPGFFRRKRSRNWQARAMKDMTYVAAKPLSHFAVELRRVKTSVRMMFRPGSGGTVIGIVSPRPGEGKTTVASNLAQIFAQSGERVAIIDGDLHRATLSQAISSGDGKRTIDGVRVIDVAELNQMLNGAKASDTASPSDLLGSPAMERVLTELRDAYDCVIVDLPPVVAVPDAYALAPFIDGFIVLCAWGATERKSIEDTFAGLTTHEGVIVGYILNMADLAALRRLGHHTVSGYYQDLRQVVSLPQRTPDTAAASTAKYRQAGA
jgi:succinoglycan biosynthesis transport protein ExoP